jgi:predicted nucleic acid-binding protein
VIVTDASFLVVALADDGEDGVEARSRLRGEELVGPHLLDVEVTSVLRPSVAERNVTARRGYQALEDLADLDLERVSHTSLLSRVWDLRANYTAYDACYVALAELFQAPLLTCDAKLAAAPGARCAFEVFPRAR